MKTEDSIDLAVLAIMWMLVIILVTFFVAMTHPHEEELLTVHALKWLWWFFLAIGVVVFSTVVILIRLWTGWRLNERQQSLAHRLYGCFALLVMGIFIITFFLDDSLSFTNLQYAPAVLIILFPCIFIFVLPALYQVAKPLTDDQLRDLHEQELDLDLSYERAFALCEKAMDLLDVDNISKERRSDPGSGTMSMMASPLPPYPGFGMPTRITISLKKNDDADTHVKISCITPYPGWTRFQFRIPSGLNQRYLNVITLFLLEKTGQTPASKETLSPEIYQGRS